MIIFLHCSDTQRQLCNVRLHNYLTKFNDSFQIEQVNEIYPLRRNDEIIFFQSILKHINCCCSVMKFICLFIWWFTLNTQGDFPYTKVTNIMVEGIWAEHGIVNNAMP